MKEYFKLNETVSNFVPREIRTLIRLHPPRVSEDIYTFVDLIHALNSYPNVNFNDRCSGGNICNHITFFGYYEIYGGDAIFINRNQFNIKNII